MDDETKDQETEEGGAEAPPYILATNEWQRLAGLTKQQILEVLAC